MLNADANAIMEGAGDVVWIPRERTEWDADLAWYNATCNESDEANAADEARRVIDAEFDQIAFDAAQDEYTVPVGDVPEDEIEF